MKLIWTNSWFDPAKEKKAAESLVTSWGADALGQNVDSPAAGQYAQSKGIPWVGYDANAKKFAPTSWQTAAVYNWGPYYLSRVKAAMDGTWKTGFYYGDMKDGFTDIAPYGPKVSAATKAKIAAKRTQIINGTFNVFSGPLYDQSGEAEGAEGHDPQGPARPVRDELAREGRRREREGLARTRRGSGADRSPAAVPVNPMEPTAEPERSPPRAAMRGPRSPAAGSRSGFRASSRTTASTSRRSRARSTRSSARTAPARAPSPTSSPASTGPTRASSRSTVRPVAFDSPRDGIAAGHRDGAPAFPARRAVHGRRERHARRHERPRPLVPAPPARDRASAWPSSASATGWRSTRARGSGSSRSASSSASRS